MQSKMSLSSMRPPWNILYLDAKFARKREENIYKDLLYGENHHDLRRVKTLFVEPIGKKRKDLSQIISATAAKRATLVNSVLNRKSNLRKEEKQESANMMKLETSLKKVSLTQSNHQSCYTVTTTSGKLEKITCSSSPSHPYYLALLSACGCTELPDSGSPSMPENFVKFIN